MNQISCPISITIVSLLAAENYRIDLLNRNLSCYLQQLAQLMPFNYWFW